MKVVELLESKDELLEKATAYLLKKLKHDFEGTSVTLDQQPVLGAARRQFDIPDNVHTWLSMSAKVGIESARHYFIHKLNSYLGPGSMLPFQPHILQKEGGAYAYITHHPLEEGNLHMAEKLAHRVNKELTSMALAYQQALAHGAEPGIETPLPWENFVLPVSRSQSPNKHEAYSISVMGNGNVSDTVFDEAWDDIMEMLKDEGYIDGIYPVNIKVRRVGGAGDITIS